MWQGLCRALGLPQLVGDPKFKTNRERYQNRVELWPILEIAFRKHSATEWVPLLEKEGIPVGVVNTLDRVMVDPQIQHRGMIVEMSTPDGRQARAIGNPMVFAEAKGGEKSFPPTHGENSTEVLRDVLGMADADIAECLRSGAVLTHESVKRASQTV